MQEGLSTRRRWESAYRAVSPVPRAAAVTARRATAAGLGGPRPWRGCRPRRRGGHGSVTAMADGRDDRRGDEDGDGSSYDWLYSGGSAGRPGGSGRPPADDPDATQVISTGLRLRLRPAVPPPGARRATTARRPASPRRRAPRRPAPAGLSRSPARSGPARGASARAAGSPCAGRLAGLPGRGPDLRLALGRQGRRRAGRRATRRPARHDVPRGGLRRPQGARRGSAPTPSCCCTPAAAPTC